MDWTHQRGVENIYTNVGAKSLIPIDLFALAGSTNRASLFCSFLLATSINISKTERLLLFVFQLSRGLPKSEGDDDVFNSDVFNSKQKEEKTATRENPVSLLWRVAEHVSAAHTAAACCRAASARYNSQS